jgi:hypothetical protein
MRRPLPSIPEGTREGARKMITTATTAEQMGGTCNTMPRKDTANDLPARIRELEAENNDLRKMNHTLPSPSRTESWYGMLLSAPAEVYDMALGGCGLRREEDNAIETPRGLLPVVSEMPSSPNSNLTLISPYGYILPHVRTRPPPSCRHIRIPSHLHLLPTPHDPPPQRASRVAET